MIRSTLFTGAAAALSLTAGNALGAISLHQGATDPTTEGFTFVNNATTGITTGSITNDAASGFDAFFVSDASSANFGAYADGLTATEQADVLANGYTATLNLRIPDTSINAAGGIAFDVNLGTNNKRLNTRFGTTSTGRLIIAYGSGEFITYGDVVATTYTELEFVYDPTTTLIDIFADGDLIRDDYAGFAGNVQNGNTNGQVIFGSTSGGGQGQGNWNLVSVVIPEPGSLALLGLGGALTLARRRREA
jgi:hypothetical protein